MNENIRMLKAWYKLANPNKKYWLIAFVTVLLTCICLIVEPIFSAKVVTYLVDNKYIWAVGALIITIVLLVIRQLVWHFNYKNTSRLVRSSYIPLQEKIFERVNKCSKDSFHKISKEKMINIVHNDVYTVAGFADTLATRCARLIRAILTIGAVFIINKAVAVMLIIVNIFDYFFYNYLTKKLAKAKQKIYEAVDDEYLAFSQVIDNRADTKKYGLYNQIKKEYLGVCNNEIDKEDERIMCANKIDNWYTVYYRVIIFIFTLFMIFILSEGKIDLTLYLIIVPYLTSGIEIFNDFFLILSEIKNANVSVNRVKTILNLTDEELIEFGSNDRDRILGEIDFKHVSYGNLCNVNCHIEKREVVLFLGKRACGKRYIANLLVRNIVPSTGNIYIDGIDILDYTITAHNDNINYITTKPSFYSGSILKNLLYVAPAKKYIVNVCEKLKINNRINSFAKGLKTNMDDLSLSEQYIISLLRLYLSNVEIMLLYEYPTYLSPEDNALVREMIDTMKKNRTIIIFSADKKCYNKFDHIYMVENNNVLKKK